MSAQVLMTKSLPTFDYGVGAGVALLVAGLIGAGLANSAKLPMQMDVYGDLGQTDPQDIREAVMPYLVGGFFQTETGLLEQRLQELPWVRDVQVQRLWPDRLAVHVAGHVAVANWGDDAVLTQSGGLIWPQQRPPSILLIEGPESQAAAVFADLQVVVPRLPVGWLLSKWQVSETGDRRAEVSLGQQHLVLEFGRAPVAEKFTLLADVVLPAIQSRLADVEAVDLRYRNGFAVRWTAAALAKEEKQ
ncbi:MAG: cell division protein FtsQ/DivIB [Oceanococcus sp.]